MNHQKKTALENTWLCLQCGSTIIPFTKTSGAFAVALVVGFAGLMIAVFFNLIFGVLVIAFSIAIPSFGKSDSAKICPSCESVNIVPSTSPAAKMKHA